MCWRCYLAQLIHTLNLSQLKGLEVQADVPEGAKKGVPGTYVVKYKQTVSWFDWVSLNEVVRALKAFGAKLRQLIRAKKLPRNNDFIFIQ